MIFMKNKKLISGILALAVVGLAIILSFNTSKDSRKSDRPNGQADSATSSIRAAYTLTQIAVHKDASSCWAAINGNVYDLTAWIPPHPGGSDAILGLCGKDGSDAFNAQHSGNSKVERILASFKIGVLK
jgi:cytochrome b involved in lipid metabolism